MAAVVSFDHRAGVLVFRICLRGADSWSYGVFYCKDNRIRTAAGLYCMLGFGTVVTQNSDSAFAAMVFLLLGLFLAGCDSFDRMERFLETLLLMFGSFKLIGILQELFPEKAKQLGSLSKFFLKKHGDMGIFPDRVHGIHCSAVVPAKA